jgi:ketosteroid isomerase-like protein
MSQENAEVVRRWIDLWTRRDWAAYEAIHDPHVVVIPPEGWPDGEVSIGCEAWIRQSIRLKESWAADRNELEELHVTGSQVVIGARWITKGRDSGIEFDRTLWAVFTLLNRRITRIDWFLDRAEALEAVGLLEQDAHADS